MSVSDRQDREAKVLESLQRGIADAAAGRVVVMGSFIDVELLREEGKTP